MSRAAGGAYTLPAGNPVVTATVISSTWANTTLSDLATAMSDSLSRSGLGNMTVPLLNPDGTAALPSYSFATEPSSGLYRVSAGLIGLSVLNRLGLQQSSTGAVSIPSASAGTPFTVTNGVAATVAALITSSQSQAAAAPLLQLRSTAANGFANLSICANSNTPNSNDLSIFQNGTDNSATVVNRANSPLNFGTNNLTYFSIAAAGNLSNVVPTLGTALTITGIGAASEMVKITDGTTNFGFFTAATVGQFGTSSNHTLAFLTNSVARLSINVSGHHIIPQPTASGAALSVTGFSGVAPLNIQNGGAAAPLALIGSNFLSTGASVPVLTGNKPAGAGTAIQQWIQVTVNGATGYIPVWQ